MLRRSIFLLPALGFALPALAADPPNSAAAHPMPAADTATFLAKTAAGNNFEIESSKLALTKTKSSAVRDFANMMVRDHTDAGVKFKKAVSEARVTAPPEQMDGQHKAIVRDLKTKEATAFDEQYVHAQYTTHVGTVDMFRAYSGGGDNARMKQFARELLPKLEEHLAHVKKLRK